MLEIHPFPPFIPKDAKYLLLGSFPGRLTTRNDEWYYGTQKGQFWKIIRIVYKRALITRKEKEDLLGKLGIALTDTIYSCERVDSNNSDSNLKIKEYNIKIVQEILKKNKIIKIYFSSRFVESVFRRHFKEIIKDYPDIELVTLPSSSPRYAKMSLIEKIKIWKSLLPSITRV
jgi:hypoxanthine-DNA glycosylase